MKKSLKITLIVVGVLVGLILLDTVQAIAFNNSPIIRIRKTYSDVHKVDIGILVETDIYDGITQTTYFRWEKHTVPIIDNNSCCKECNCDETIKLIKENETAWTLTELKDNGEYVYNKHSFINFNGTGKNKFAFFKNDEDGNTLSEIKGEFSINKNNEIILVPDGNKNTKITCKIGKEIDLIAVLECDMNFGTFMLQKEGTINLPEEVKNVISKIKAIVVKGNQDNYGEPKSINEEELNTFINVLNNTKVWTGAITLPSVQYEIELYDINNKSIAEIKYTKGHYFVIEVNNKEYPLTNVDEEKLNTILVK